MKFPQALIEGRLIKRYKRFLADVQLLSGEEVTVHVPNSGSMMGLVDPGNQVWISPQDKPERQLKYTLEFIKVGPSLVGVNTSWPNKLTEESILNGTIAELQGYPILKREMARGGSRFDFMLENDQGRCYVEVKNVTLQRGQGAYFPDAVTTRGAKHLRDLALAVRQGDRAVMLYIIQRMDCNYLSYASDIDPAYWRAYKEASAAGVEILCYECDMNLEGIAVTKPVPIRI